MLSKEEKLKKLNSLNDDFNKKFGKNTVNFLNKIDKSVEVFSTGLMTLDLAIGAGGIPKGRIIEVFGSEGSGKTSLCLHLIGQIQKQGGIALFIDVEDAFDPNLASIMGVDVEDEDSFIYANPKSAEEAFTIINEYSQYVDLIVVDSVAAMAVCAETNSDVGDVHVSLLARFLSQELRRLINTLRDSICTVMFINQVRDNISITGYGGGGQITPGGKALKFYSSLRIDVRKKSDLKKGDEVIGSLVRIKIVKNKVGTPFKVVEIENLFNKGFSSEGLIIDAALELGLLSRKGAWFYLGENQVSQGREKLREKLETDEEFKNKLISLIQQKDSLGESFIKDDRTEFTDDDRKPRDMSSISVVEID